MCIYVECVTEAILQINGTKRWQFGKVMPKA